MSFVKELLGLFFLDKIVGGRERGLNLGDGDNGNLLLLIVLITIEKQVQENKARIEHLERRCSCDFDRGGRDRFFDNGFHNNGCNCFHDDRCNFFAGQFR